MQVNRCGTCALSESTTPREVMLDNDLGEYWRADDAWRRVKLYLLSRGLADTRDASYVALDVPSEVRVELWVSCFVPDGVAEIAERFPEQWRAPLDIEGDREVCRQLLESVIDRADALVAEVNGDVDALGGDEPRAAPRPREAARSVADGAAADLRRLTPRSQTRASADRGRSPSLALACLRYLAVLGLTARRNLFIFHHHSFHRVR